MRLALSDEDAKFRDELRDFFTTQVPAEILERARNDELRFPEDMVATQQILNAAGLAVPNWPVEWGGKDWTPLQRQIWSDELRMARVPEPLAFNASMIGPVIAQFGSQEMKQRFLPRRQTWTSGGHKASPSQRPARTWRACALRRCATATTT